MLAFKFVRSALIVAVVALLCACSGSSLPRISVNAATVDTVKNKKTFHYTGKRQIFIVPAGVKQLTVVALGGQGAGFNVYPSTAPPGYPGRVYAVIQVHAGDKLYVFVGGSGTHGGFNGGGAGGLSGQGSYTGNPGGGASDVRLGGDKLQNRIIVAAGGGGAGQAVDYYATAAGGNGGGMSGQPGGGSGSTYGGGGGAGGTQRKGGSGGAAGACYSGSQCGQRGGKGALGLGGNGGAAGRCRNSGGGGGAGGGYYGGGGGGGGGAYSGLTFHCYYPGQGGGGAGGSSYIEPHAIKSRTWTGWRAKGDGLVVFSWN